MADGETGKELLERLTEIKGVGSVTAERLRESFTPAEFARLVEREDVASLSNKGGIPPSRSAEILARLRGLPLADGYLSTRRVEEIYRDIIERMSGYASTQYARQRCRIFMPLSDMEAIEAISNRIAMWREEYEAMGRERANEFKSRIKGLEGLSEPSRRTYVSDRVVVVDSHEDLEALGEMGIDRYVRAYTVGDAVIDEGDMVLYLYSSGMLDVSVVDNIVTMPFSRADVPTAAPEVEIEYMENNRETLEKVAGAMEILGRESSALKALKILDSVRNTSSLIEYDKALAIIEDMCSSVNEMLKEKIMSSTLGGEELLNLLSGGRSSAIEEIMADGLKDLRERLSRELPDELLSPLPVKESYPLAPDEETLEGNYRSYVMQARMNGYNTLVEAAVELGGLRRRIATEIEELQELDFRLAVAMFSSDYRLSRATFVGRGFKLEGTSHMGLRSGANVVDVDYHLGQEERIALLTGANSGGKTTLLETIVQVYVMAACGLPVPADRAELEPVEGVVLYSQQRNLNAGAFETFLRSFLPLAASNRKRIILADEMEAITELEAAAKIISAVLESIEESGSIGIFVTHMADEIARYTDVRIDGIEATGLGEDNSLVVDRTPRIGYRAHSTPELIVEKLHRSGGLDQRTKALVERILSRFGES